MEQPLPNDHAVVTKRRARIGTKLAPYLLLFPGGMWLIVFFVVPLVTMLSLSLQTGEPFTGQFRLTWHFSEFWYVITTYRLEFVRSLAYGGPRR